MKKSERAGKVGWFALFTGPSIVAFFLVMVVPFVYGIYLTFTNYNAISIGYETVGFANYITVFQDAEFWQHLLLTLKYVLASALLCNIVAFALAWILTNGLKLQSFFRSGFFVPNLIGGIVLGYIWKFLFANVFTQVGKSWGVDWLSTSFLTNPDRALLALVIVTVWQYAGYLMMIYVAGIVAVPADIYEAADIDGATGLRKVFHVTIPLVVPSFVICLFITISRGFMAYDLNLSLTNGGPFGSTQLSAMHVYLKAFQERQYGAGQAEAIILFALVAIVSVSQVLITKKFEVEA